MLEKILEKILSFLWLKEIEEQKALWKMKVENPKKYGLLELEKILHYIDWINWIEDILNKAESWEWIIVQINGGKILEVKKINKDLLNKLRFQINDLYLKLEEWHKKYKILNKCSKDLEKSYWEFKNFFEKNRWKMEQQDIIKFILRRKKLLKEIWLELNK